MKFKSTKTSVEKANGHVLAVARVALHHLVGRLEAHLRDLAHGQRLVVGLLGGDHGRVGGKREVNARVWDEICLRSNDKDSHIC